MRRSKVYQWLNRVNIPGLNGGGLGLFPSLLSIILAYPVNAHDRYM